jgi:hypothetical protein
VRRRELLIVLLLLLLLLLLLIRMRKRPCDAGLLIDLSALSKERGRLRPRGYVANSYY